MAKKGKTEGVNKSQAIRDYLAAHADAGPKDVVAALKEKGLDVSPGLVGLVKHKKNQKKGARKAGRPRADRVAKSGANKSDAVRQYLASHPDASPVAVKDALAQTGIKISASLASAIKYSKGGKKARASTRRGPGRPRRVAASMNGAVTAEDLLEAKKLADSLGGVPRARQALELLEQLS